MAEPTQSPFGNVSTEDVYKIIGQLYTQIYALSNENATLSRGLSEAQAKNHELEVAAQKKGLEQMIDQMKQQPSIDMPLKNTDESQ